MENPWTRLPDRPPFILPEDLPIIERYDRRDRVSHIRSEVLPLPFLGNPISSKVVLLHLNPGFVDENIALFRSNELYAEQSWKSLTFDSDPPFFYLSAKFSFTPGYEYWSKRLREVIQEVGRSNVLRKVMCLEYFGYRSVGEPKYPQLLPSQAYAFYLAQQAIDVRKVVVILRSKNEWLKSVPGLADYPYVELNSPRSAYVSRKNVRGGGFDRIVEALR